MTKITIETKDAALRDFLFDTLRDHVKLKVFFGNDTKTSSCVAGAMYVHSYQEAATMEIEFQDGVRCPDPSSILTEIVLVG